MRLRLELTSPNRLHFEWSGGLWGAFLCFSPFARILWLILVTFPQLNMLSAGDTENLTPLRQILRGRSLGGGGGSPQEPWATRKGRLCPRPLGGSVCAREDLGGSVDRSVTRFPVPGLWSTGIATLFEKCLDLSVTHWSWRLFHFVCGLRSFLRFRKCIEDAHRNLSL